MILQESHTIGLLSIRIDKYETLFRSQSYSTNNYLIKVVQFAADLYISIGSDIGGLRRGQEKLELGLLKPVGTLCDQGCGPEKLGVDVVEG